MKKVFQHPPEATTGRKYWRSLEEYSNTSEFKEWLHQEFPRGAAVFEEKDGVSRRDFIRIMGASLALAGLGLSGCRRPEANIVPFTKTPEWMIPGRNLHYTTAMPRRLGSMPLLVTSYDGRPVKIEGNPLHPASGGKTDVFAQASILGLYDPDRSRSYLKDGEKSDAATFIKEIQAFRAQWKENSGAGVAVLSEEFNSPTLDRLRGELTKQFPQLTWATYEPALLGSGLEDAATAAFGAGMRLLPNFGAAKIIYSVGSDFLNAEEGGIPAIRGFTNGRRVEKKGDPMNRLYVVEDRFTTTGGMADHRLRLPARHYRAFLLTLARELMSLGVGGAVPQVAGAMGNVPELAGIDLNWVTESARDLKNNAGKSLLVIGSGLSSDLHALALAINSALGNIGTTLKTVRTNRPASVTLEELGEKLASGQIKDLIVLGGNPAYNVPADFDWKGMRSRLTRLIRVGLYEDETSEGANWHVPLAHYLESWGDTRAADGTHLSIQPLILPIHGAISVWNVAAAMAGLNVGEGLDLVQETARLKIQSPSVEAPAFKESWTKYVHDGFLAKTEWPEVGGSLDGNRLAAEARDNTPEAVSGELEVTFALSLSVDDGRYLNNGWMQEVPDPISKLTWENAIYVSPTTAEKLGVTSVPVNGIYTCDVLRIEADGRTLEAPAHVVPGQADDSLALFLGYGQTHTGRVGKGSGYNAYQLRTLRSPWLATQTSVSKTGRKVQLAVTQEHSSMEGRSLVREAPLEHFNENPLFASVKNVGVESHSPENRSFYDVPPMNGVNQWGMSIDLNTCVGCNACVVSCQSENNIPIVGKEQVKLSREMHWMRIDRYFTSPMERPGDRADEPELLMQPVACMHCENAPCETVCPVTATVHSDEGLNVMAYNRCIGTRYCANNCPYKVRRFNFFDYNKRELDELYKGPLGPVVNEETLKMSKNPNVTVRMRGVMEKCTYCVQRIEATKIDTLVKAGGTDHTMVPTDSVKTACQQACPADAIVFGNLSDPNSEVVKKKASPLRYGLLEYLNVLPRTTYLARLRNPNMAMPDAERRVKEMLQTLGSHHHAHGGEQVEGHSTEGDVHSDPAHAENGGHH